jgi:hypothetical protein
VGVIGRDRVREGDGPEALRERWAGLGGVRGASKVCTWLLVGV